MKRLFFILVFFFALPISAQEYTIQTRNGESVSAEISACTDTGFTAVTATESRNINYEDCSSAALSGAAESITPESIQVVLSDNSIVYVKDVLLSDGVITLDFGTVKHTVKESQIHSIRFNPDAALNEAWNEIIQTEAQEDLLIIVKKGKLSYHRGHVQGITSDKIPFKLDSDVLPVARSKAFGLRVTRAAESFDKAELGFGISADGSRWAVGAFEFESGKLRAISRLGIALEFGSSPGEIQKIEFSSAPETYLSDLDMASWKWTPFVSAPGMPESILRKFNQPRKDQGFGQTPLSIEQKTFSKGLCVRSKTEMTFRLPQSYSRLNATIGIDDSARPRGNMDLEVFADDKSVFKCTATGTDPAKEISVPIAGAKRIRILVDFGTDGSVGDTLVIGSPRLEE